MVQSWNSLAFIHWRYEPADVQRLLPPGLTVQTFDGSAWVGLIPFLMRVRLPRGPAVPWVSTFAETNVRTYASAADGSTGIWFFSLEAARLGAVLVGRWGYRLPYVWARMRVERTGDTWSYRARRRWPGPRGASSSVGVEVGEPLGPEEVGLLDRFLTARWSLYSSHPHGLSGASAYHAPWPLHRARLLHIDDALVPASGLPPPEWEPVVHWSPGVDVRIGWPYRLAVPSG